MEKLQSITEDCAVVNHTKAGKKLQRFSKANISLILNSYLECGWCDGGCLIFAEGLRDWSYDTLAIGGIKTYFKEGTWTIDHYFVYNGDTLTGDTLCIDADGVSTAKELLFKWYTFEIANCPHRLSSSLASMEELDVTTTEVPRDLFLSAKVSELLKDQLGTFENFKF